MRTVLRGGNGLLTPSLLARLAEPVANRWPATLFAGLSGSLAARTRSGLITLTGTGALRWRPAPGALVNYLINPSFDPSGAAFGTAGGTFAFSSERATLGTTSGKFTVTAAGGMRRVYMSFAGFIPAGTYLVAVDVYNASAAAKTAILGIEFGGNSPLSAFTPSSTLPPGQWTRLAGTVVVLRDTEVGIINVLRNETDFALGDVFFLDRGMLLNATSDSYLDASTAPRGAWVRLVTGQLASAHAGASFPQAMAWVEEGTTNEIRDSLFGNTTITAHWSAVGTGTTLSRDTSIWQYRTRFYGLGFGVARVVTDGTVAGQGIELVPSVAPAVSAGQVRTAQVSLRRESGTGGLKLQIVGFDSSNNQTEIFETAFTPPANGAAMGDQLPSVTANFANASTVKYIVRVVTATASAQTFSVGYIGCEAKAYATSPCAGNMGTGYSWAGTAHASESSRSAAQVTIANSGTLPPGSPAPPFSVALWLTKLLTPAVNSAWWAANGGSNLASGPTLIARADGKMALSPRGDGTGAVVTAAAIPTSEMHHYAMTWDGITFRAYLDGALIGTSSTAPAILDTTSRLGGNGGWGFASGGLLYAVRALAPQEVATLYAFGLARAGYDTLREAA